MKRAPVHLTKSVLSKGTRGRLPASDFVFPVERRFPIPDLYHGRLALIYVMSPSLAADRETVVKAVLARYPELRTFWESRFASKRRKAAARTRGGAVARPARPARPVITPARRRERRLTNPSSEDNMPIYVVNPLAYDETDVVMVGKPRRRLVRARTPGKPGRRSERMTLPSSEMHALNPKTGAAFCGAGKNRQGVVVSEKIHKANKKLVTCMRCIKIINMNHEEDHLHGFVERDLKPRAVKAGKKEKREQHKMLRGGDQGRWVSLNGHHISTGKAYGHHPKMDAKRRAALEERRKSAFYRGTENIKDFAKYAGWNNRPTQTIGEKRTAILASRKAEADARLAAEEAARAGAARARLAETGFEETIALMSERPVMEYMDRDLLRAGYMSEEEYDRDIAETTRALRASADEDRRAEMARRGRMGAAAAATRRAERAAAEEVRGAEAVRRMMGPPEGYVGNPRGKSRGTRAQAAGLKKGQSLMQQAAAAYRAGKYASMQDALRGVARKRNPTLLEEAMVSNPRRKAPAKKGKKVGGRPSAADRARFEAMLDRVRAKNRAKKASAARVSYAAEEYMDNPRKKGAKKSAKSAQGNAAKAMSLYRSGRADSLAEAWAMVKRRA
jgi:REP element-mobilizing transposase RayT